MPSSLLFDLVAMRPSVCRARRVGRSRPGRSSPTIGGCSTADPGGGRPSSTRSIRGRSGTRRRRHRRSAGHHRAPRLPRRRSASTRSGSRRSSPRRWPTSATTWPTTATSTRSSAPSPTSTDSSPRPTGAACGSCSTSCRTTPRTSTRGSSSRARRATNPKRDWYIWRDPAPDGGPPNNWMSVFGGPAWEWTRRPASTTCTCSSPKQPDLNWRNPDGAGRHARRAALLARPRRRRLPHRRAAGMLIKDPELRDNPPNPTA